MIRAHKDLDDILALYGMEDTRDAWIDGWETSSATCSDAGLSFLDTSCVDERCRILEMEDGLRNAVIEGRALFTRHPALKPLLWHCHDTAFRRAVPLDPARFRFAAIPEDIDDAAPLFYIYFFLSGIPYTMAYHRQLRIPRNVTIDTLKDILVWIDDYTTKNNRRGLSHNQVGWLGLHFSGRLYHLGRLQFEHSRYYYDFRAFRRESGGRTIVLAGDGMRFRRDGQFDGANGIEDPDAWTTSLTMTDAVIAGYPVHPYGYARRDPVELPAREWRQVLQQGDPTVGVHIPATGPMDFDRCGDSFAQVFPFWRTYFPDYRIHAFTCSSWLLDQQFEQALNPDSNIVRFLREWYLTPHPRASGRETLHRVFGISEADAGTLATLPQATSLERAIVRHLQQGKHWRSAGALMFPHNMDWGRQVYRGEWKRKHEGAEGMRVGE